MAPVGNQVDYLHSLSPFPGLIKQKANCPTLSHLVMMEAIPDELKAEADAAGIRLLTFEELENIGKKATNRPPHIPPTVWFMGLFVLHFRLFSLLDLGDKSVGSFVFGSDCLTV